MRQSLGDHQRLPDFFIVGAPKCGTTSFNEYLRQHPEIFIPKKKESHFFGSDLNFRFGRIRERNNYISLFGEAKNEKRVGETSVWYLYSKQAATEIKEFCPFASIIIMLRNPVDMLYSQHSELLYNGNEDIADFETAFNAEGDRKQGLRIPKGAHYPAGLFYKETAKYTEQVKRYLNTFGRDSVHIIIFDDFKTDTSKVYKETLHFLGVKDDFQPDFEVINPNKRVRSKALRNFLNDPSHFVIKVGRIFIPRPLRDPLFRGLKHFNKRYQPRQPMDPELRKRLQLKFAPEIEQLSELLRRDLTHWINE